MKTPKNARYRSSIRYTRGGTPWLNGAIAVIFASLPLATMLWVLPITGIGIA